MPDRSLRRRGRPLGVGVLGRRPGAVPQLRRLPAARRLFPGASVPRPVLGRVEEDLLALSGDGPRRGVELLELLLERGELGLEDLVLLRHAVDGHLGDEQVFGHRWALHPQAALDELLDGQLPRVVVVKEHENLLRVVHREVNHPELVVDLGLVDGLFDLLQGQRAAVVHVRRLEDLAELREYQLAVPVLLPLLLARVRGSRADRPLDHDTYHEVQHAEGPQANERNEKDVHPWLNLHNIANNQFRPVVQRDDLQKRYQ
mmetsp:Transcript_30299/g.79353  ORF Transcript_30299/g.79353 Transcript_30299/m.79353 type:complete len:259 (+) Transcript_30299:282-1058(+)